MTGANVVQLNVPTRSVSECLFSHATCEAGSRTLDSGFRKLSACHFPRARQLTSDRAGDESWA